MLLKSCRLHYPCKLSELLNTVKLHKFTIAVILIDNILRILFSINVSWNIFGMNWFCYQTSEDFQSFQKLWPINTNWAPPPCSGDVQVLNERLQQKKRQHEEEIFPAVSRHGIGYLLGFWCDFFLLLFGKHFFVFFICEVEKGICVPLLATFQVMIFFFFVKTNLSWMNKQKILSEQLSLLSNLFRNMQEQVKWIRECTVYMHIIGYIN